MLFAQDNYTSKDLQSFVNIYMAQKELRIDKQSEMMSLLNEHQLSKARYQEILRKSLKGENLNLTESEQSFLNAVEQLNKVASEEKKEGTSSGVIGIEMLCKKYDLSFADYTTILNRYKTDIKFQRSLKPYFETYIKGN